MPGIVECVPNFSEGRERAIVEAIEAAIGSVRGVAILDRTMDADHNRSVITFAGSPAAVLEAAFRGVAEAARRIDLRLHRGVHPRIGAADVVPFVPVSGSSLEECVALAEALGERIWRELGVPVYLYEAAARRPERVRLENVRRGNFEGLSEEVRVNPERMPDFGTAGLHPTAGATVVGARKFLIAWNINLETPDVAVAKSIARKIRTSSGGFPAVKALGLPLVSRNQAQVSMNLTDFEVTPPDVVYRAVEAEAHHAGTTIAESELIGLIPRAALERAGAGMLRIGNFRPDCVLENRMAQAIQSSNDLAQFLDALAAPHSAPGGGSAAAASGALAAALGVMAASGSDVPAEAFEADRQFFAAAVERDGEAFEAFVRAQKAGGADVQNVLHQAARIPLEVAEEAASMKERLRTLRSSVKHEYECDVDTAIALSGACVAGALAIVKANLEELQDTELRGEVQERVSKLESFIK